VAAASTRRTVEKLFRDYLNPLLVPRGFSRHGRSYHLVSPMMDYLIVNVQASSGSWQEEFIFYVNVGIAPEPWLDCQYDGESPERRRDLPGIEDAELLSRVSPPRGSQWKVDTSPESADEVGPQIVAGLGPKVDEGMRLLDRETLLDRARSRDLAGWTVADAALLVVLLAARGPSDELTDLLESRQWSADFERWARGRAEQSAPHS
jgi:hypothetical protein